MTRPCHGAAWLGRTTRAVTVLVGLTGVVSQAVQHTDPTFFLAYFTVDSVLLLALVLTVGLVRPLGGVLSAVRGAAVVGVLVSGLVYATVIVPTSSAGSWLLPSDPWSSAATLLMHGVTPVLAVLDDLTHQHQEATPRGWVWVSRSVLWPFAYLVVVGGLALVGVGRVPYSFLQPATMGWGTVILATPAIVILTIVLAWAVLGLRTIATRL